MPQKPQERRTLSERIADKVAETVGSWKFIIFQSCLIITWITLNTLKIITWDAYPFILLNLGLSFQAAYTAPFIMMSQNRQAEIDRSRSEEDYEVNKLAEAEIETIQTELETVKLHVQNNVNLKDDLVLIQQQLEILHKTLETKLPSK